jgi:type 2 lantibiotic biosynthesis protein LanM
MGEHRKPTTASCLITDQPIPFEDVLLPFVKMACGQLTTRIEPISRFFHETAWRALERHLLVRLSGLSAQALQLDFSTFIALSQAAFPVPSGIPQNLSRDLYCQFVQELFHGGIKDFFREHKILARLVATTTENWISATEEFSNRLVADLPLIREISGSELQLGLVSDIQPGLGDPHCHGRTVIGLSFESGLRVIYKPRDIGIEAAYYDLVSWFNHAGAPLQFRVLWVLKRPHYGWVEHVDPLPCTTYEQVRRFYKRAGMLLCVMYVLGATDCSCDNIIAHAEQPILVDAETIAQHVFVDHALPRGLGAHTVARRQLINSVMRTGFLPHYDYQGGVVRDLSALGDGEYYEVVPTWLNINSDQMALGLRAVQTDRLSQPFLGDDRVSSREFVQEIVAGFETMYCFLADKRRQLLAPNGPMAPIFQVPTRTVLRSSAVYQNLLERMTYDVAVRRSLDFERALRSLPAVFGANTRESSAVIRAEKKAVERGDIPYFVTFPRANAVYADGEVVAEAIAEELGGELVIRRLSQLGEPDLRAQIALIRACLRQEKMERGVGDPTITIKVKQHRQGARMTRRMLESAIAIAERVVGDAFHAGDSSAAWIGEAPIRGGRRSQVEIVDLSLYAGNSGIALFLAAAAWATSRVGLAQLALDALEPVRQLLRNPLWRKRVASDLGLGELGGIIYALVRVGALLKEESLLADAIRAAALVTSRRISDDHQFDVLDGAAGCILGLLALLRVTKAEMATNRARQLGHHLLRHRVASEPGPRAWETTKGEILTGFSHGAAGISYSLLRLYKCIGGDEFRAAALEGIAYERCVFSQEAGNWPDFRRRDAENSGQPFMLSWCHGAPGVGLARVGSLQLIRDERLHDEIVVALETTKQAKIASVDNLCCGNFGRIDFFFTAGQTLSCPSLVRLANDYAIEVLDRAEQSNFKLGCTSPASLYAPGFFQGESGIGYELLRLASRGRLPSVLLWQ